MAEEGSLEQIRELLEYLAFAVRDGNQYRGTLVFKFRLDKEPDGRGEVVFTIRVEESGVQLYEGFPPDENITCHVICGAKEFLYIYSGKARATDMLRLGFQGKIWVSDFKIKECVRFAEAFEFTKWDAFYEKGRDPEIFKKGSPLVVDVRKALPEPTPVPREKPSAKPSPPLLPHFLMNPAQYTRKIDPVELLFGSRTMQPFLQPLPYNRRRLLGPSLPYVTPMKKLKPAHTRNVDMVTVLNNAYRRSDLQSPDADFHKMITFPIPVPASCEHAAETFAIPETAPMTEFIKQHLVLRSGEYHPLPLYPATLARRHELPKPQLSVELDCGSWYDLTYLPVEGPASTTSLVHVIETELAKRVNKVLVKWREIRSRNPWTHRRKYTHEPAAKDFGQMSPPPELPWTWKDS